MPEKPVVTVYIDFKSPYAYLAKDPARDLERRFDISLDWLPYILDIPSYLGSARLDAEGSVIEENRNAHQWRRVRYSYMDCRRQARKRGLVIRGHAEDLGFDAGRRRHALRQAPGTPTRCAAISTSPSSASGSANSTSKTRPSSNRCSPKPVPTRRGAAAWLAGDGPREVALISREAEEKGVFGVPPS